MSGPPDVVGAARALDAHPAHHLASRVRRGPDNVCHECMTAGAIPHERDARPITFIGAAHSTHITECAALLSGRVRCTLQEE